MTTATPRLTRSQHILNILTSYRAWRASQKAYATAVETGDKADIPAAENALRKAYDEYQKYSPRKE